MLWRRVTCDQGGEEAHSAMPVVLDLVPCDVALSEVGEKNRQSREAEVDRQDSALVDSSCVMYHHQQVHHRKYERLFPGSPRQLGDATAKSPD